MQSFELEIDHSIEFFRKNGQLTGDRIRDKTYHSFGGKGKFFAAKRDESLFDFWLLSGKYLKPVSLGNNKGFTYIKVGAKFFGIEAKQTAEKSLPYKNVKEHQVKNLQLVNELGGVGIFLINFHSVGKRGKEAWNNTYALNVDDYIFYQMTHNRSSIEESYVAEKGFKLDRIRVGFSKPKKEESKSKPKMGWDLLSLQEWDI